MWWGHHGIDPLHERNGDSSFKEVDECILIGDLTEGNVVLELGDIISEWQGFQDCGGGEPCN